MNKQKQNKLGQTVINKQQQSEWLRCIADVKAYKVEPEKVRACINAPKRLPAQSDEPHCLSQPQQTRLGNMEELPPLQLGSTSGLDAAKARKLRRGQIPIDARLDLHGCTQAQAYAQLCRGIHQAVASRWQLLLVITGKGPAGKGVLRQQLPEWVNRPEIRTKLLALLPARQEHGGSGAFYLVVKRARHG